VRNMLWEFLSSPSMLAIFPLQDWLSLDVKARRPERNEERINEPANPNHHWKFRIHFPLERLSELSETNAEISGLLKDSGRFISQYSRAW